jgi:hypothetical protein
VNRDKDMVAAPLPIISAASADICASVV